MIGDKEDNFYFWGDVVYLIFEILFKLKGYLGYLDGNLGLGFNGISVVLIGKYFDWLIGVEVVVGLLMLGISYVDIDILVVELVYIWVFNGGF